MYTENNIGVRVQCIRKLLYDRRRIVRVPSRDRSAIVQRLFNDRKTETERELSYDRYCMHTIFSTGLRTKILMTSYYDYGTEIIPTCTVVLHVQYEIIIIGASLSKYETHPPRNKLLLLLCLLGEVLLVSNEPVCLLLQTVQPLHQQLQVLLKDLTWEENIGGEVREGGGGFRNKQERNREIH